MNTTTSWPANALQDGLPHSSQPLALAEQFPIWLIATGREALQTIEYTTRISDLVADARLGEFDFLPVTRGGRIQRLLHLRTLRRSTDITSPELLRRTVWSRAESLSERVLMSVADPLLSFIIEADTRPCRLLLQRGQVVGIVTQSDLQRLPVRPVLFALVTHVELLMARLLRESGQFDELFRFLDVGTRDSINAKWEKLQRSGLAIDRVSAMQFGQKSKLLVRLPWHIDVATAGRELAEIEKLRHLVAHSGDYALTRATASVTARRARLAQKWVDLLTGLTAGPDRSGQVEGSGTSPEPQLSEPSASSRK